ncbi:hypothetical protein GCM10009583_17990 [Ornithinicoccus hortensis]
MLLVGLQHGVDHVGVFAAGALRGAHPLGVVTELTYVDHPLSLVTAGNGANRIPGPGRRPVTGRGSRRVYGVLVTTMRERR